LIVIYYLPTSPGVGFVILAGLAFLGCGGAYIMWKNVLLTLAATLVTSGGLLQCIKNFPLHIKDVASRTPVDESVWAQLIFVCIIIYVVVNMLVCLLSPKKYTVKLTTAVSIVFIVMALIAFYTDPTGISMRSFDRLLVYVLGTVIVVFFSAVPVLISTIINSIIWRGIRRVPR